MMQRFLWLLLLLMGLLLVACSAETAEPPALAALSPTTIPPTAVPPTDIPPTDVPPTDVPTTATAAPTLAPTETPEPIAQGSTVNGYVNVLYTQNNADLLDSGERLKFVSVYSIW